MAFQPVVRPVSEPSFIRVCSGAKATPPGATGTSTKDENRRRCTHDPSPRKKARLLSPLWRRRSTFRKTHPGVCENFRQARIPEPDVKAPFQKISDRPVKSSSDRASNASSNHASICPIEAAAMRFCAAWGGGSNHRSSRRASIFAYPSTFPSGFPLCNQDSHNRVHNHLRMIRFVLQSRLESGQVEIRINPDNIVQYLTM